MTSSPPTLAGLLRLPGIALFMGGRFLAATGIWMERIAIGWLFWEITGSAAWVGVAAALRLAPALVLGPLGGVLTDRAGSVRLLRLSHGGNVLVLLAMVPLAGALPLWALCAAVGGLGILQGLAAAPIKAVVVQIVPRVHLSTAIPLSTAGFQLAGFVGPALAGLAIAASGVGAALLAAALSHAVFVAALARWRGHDTRAGAEGGTMLAELAEAVRHAAGDRFLAPIFFLHLVAALCLRPVIDLMPAIAGAIDGAGPTTLGLLTSALGGGAVVGAVLMSLGARETALPVRVLVGTIAASLAMVALAAASDVVVAAAMAAGFGLALVVRATASLTLVQIAVPDALRGRVSGLYSMVLRAGTALGAVLIGLMADRVGLGPSLSAAAAVAILLAGLRARCVLGLAQALAANLQPNDRAPGT